MFKAVKHGKVRFSGSLTAGTWDQVFKPNEDFLTAAVFSRLMYLTPEALAGLLPKREEIWERCRMLHSGPTGR